jgi:hypothetical protein
MSDIDIDQIESLKNENNQLKLDKISLLIKNQKFNIVIQKLYRLTVEQNQEINKICEMHFDKWSKELHEISEILKISPLRVVSQIIPFDEKKRILKQYAEFQNYNNNIPSIIILNKHDLLYKKIVEKKSNYKKILETNNFIVLKK